MSEDERHRRALRRFPAVLAVLLVLGGVAALVVGLAGQQHPPQPPMDAAAATTASTTPSDRSPAPAPPAAAARTLAPSVPTHLDVPAIGVSSDLLRLGLRPDGTVQVPPLTRDSRAGWYEGSPTPGQLGPAVILGHVDSARYGPGVFFRLGALRPGDAIRVTRADGTVADFRVDRVASYPKSAFPTLAVYGNTADAELRLITCGGDFDPSTRNYLNDIVVYASLTGESP